MAGVGGFIPEASAREDRLDGRSVFDEPIPVFSVNGVLGRRGLGLQQLSVLQIVGILHIPCRVEFGNVQRFKALVVGHDLAVILHGKAHGSENRLALALNKRNRMEGTAFRIQRNRHIKLGQSFDLPLQFCPAQVLQLVGKSLGHRLLQLVDRLTHSLPVFRRKSAHAFQQSCHTAAFSQKGDPQFFHLSGALSLFQLLLKIFLQPRNFFKHLHPPLCLLTALILL